MEKRRYTPISNGCSGCQSKRMGGEGQRKMDAKDRRKAGLKEDKTKITDKKNERREDSWKEGRKQGG